MNINFSNYASQFKNNQYRKNNQNSPINKKEFRSTSSNPRNFDSVSITGGMRIDKGTASETTVSINRNAYDKILNSTTYGEPKWEEMGIDDEKRWVVVNGQRFECELTPEEKALRKNCQKTLLDYISEKDETKEKLKSKGSNQPQGNVQALTNNPDAMNLLSRIFKTNNPDQILNYLA